MSASVSDITIALKHANLLRPLRPKEVITRRDAAVDAANDLSLSLYSSWPLAPTPQTEGARTVV